MGAKLLHFRFNKIDRLIRVLGGEITHLVSFDYGWFDKICDRIKYLISKKSGITDGINHNFEKIILEKIDWYDSLPIQKYFS